jgi:adenylate cyclase
MFRWLDTQPSKQPGQIGAAVEPRRVSVAVLPFLNLSPEPDQEYFCDGVSEEIINSLTHVSGLNVIARTSAFQFKGASVDVREVGQRLDADVVIEGSVRKAGDHLRITAQAVQTESGHYLWSETFRRELKDVFAVQEEIAQSVAGLLRLHMPEARHRAHASDRNLEAYIRYLKARVLIYQQSRVRRKMGFLFQNAALFDFLNLYDNLALRLRRLTNKSDQEIEESIDRVLHQVGLGADREKMPAAL